jgi:hypothetical protein
MGRIPVMTAYYAMPVCWPRPWTVLRACFVTRNGTFVDRIFMPVDIRFMHFILWNRRADGQLRSDGQ